MADRLVLDVPIAAPPITEYTVARLDISYTDMRVYIILRGSDGSRKDFDLNGPDAQVALTAIGRGPSKQALTALTQLGLLQGSIIST